MNNQLTTTTRNITLQETIAELHHAYDLMNGTFFGGRLTPVLITVHTGKKNVLGWYTSFKSWKIRNEEGNELNEINLVAENLQRGKMQVLQTLLHEAVHHWCNLEEIKETSRGGTWHNKKFKEEAAKYGLEYTHEKADPKIDYSAVTLTKAAYDTIDSWELKDEAFNLSRIEIQGKSKKKTTYKWTCKCDLKPQIIRTTKPELRAICPDCEAWFECQD